MIINGRNLCKIQYGLEIREIQKWRRAFDRFNLTRNRQLLFITKFPSILTSN